MRWAVIASCRSWAARGSSSGDTVVLHLDLAPRLTLPHPRIDAVRGCAANAARWSTAFEQTDQEDGIAVDELALSPDTVLEEVAHDDLDGVGPAVALRTRAAAVTGRHQAGLPYRTLGGADGLDTERPVTATAVPRFQWDNRGDGAMWVWMPLLAG
ncbi:hypothetical protein [Streptomyces flaveolus]|uniref:hypothetical protein n=1 Tax=Streptomyces flaveolus TaxID=67297 RepID=UPI0038239E5A